MSCEVCKFKSHKRCAVKAINNCKWTTLASVGKDIIEDDEGVRNPPPFDLPVVVLVSSISFDVLRRTSPCHISGWRVICPSLPNVPSATKRAGRFLGESRLSFFVFFLSRGSLIIWLLLFSIFFVSVCFAMSDAQTAGLALPVVPGHGSHGLPPTVPGALPTGPLPGQHRPAHGSPQRRCVYIHNYSPTHYVTLNDGRRKSKQKGKLGQIHTRTRSWRKAESPVPTGM